MFTVRIVGRDGTEADLEVPTAVVALDLALRADAAGFVWSAVRAQEDGRPLSVSALRDLAQAAAVRDPGQSSYLVEIERTARRAATARLS